MIEDKLKKENGEEKPQKLLLDWNPNTVLSIKSDSVKSPTTQLDDDFDRSVNKNSDFKKRWNKLRYGSPNHDDMCETCLIEGCKESVAPLSDSSSEDLQLLEPDIVEESSSRGFSISNHTSFSDFYFFKEPESSETSSDSEEEISVL